MKDSVSTILTTVTATNTTSGYIPRSYITSTIPYATSIVGTLSFNVGKKIYKCAYCGTLHENKTGTCDKCGASMSEAEEVEE